LTANRMITAFWLWFESSSGGVENSFFVFAVSAIGSGSSAHMHQFPFLFR
jgi:hypothetical protein